MAAALTLRTYERDGRVHPRCIPNISAAFMPELMRELQRHDPNLAMADIETDRVTVPMDRNIPILGLERVNLAFCIIAHDNERIRDAKDEIEATISRMLQGALHPIVGVYAVVKTV